LAAGTKLLARRISMDVQLQKWLRWSVAISSLWGADGLRETGVTAAPGKDFV
jgi:hypothetical protein